MLLDRVIAELTHLADHGPGAPLLISHGHEGLQGSAHRLGVGVVGVVDDGDAVGALGDLHAPLARRLIGLQHGDDVSQIDPCGEGEGRGGKRVGDLVLPREGELHGHRAALPVQGEAGPGECVEGDVARAHDSIGRLAEGHDRR